MFILNEVCYLPRNDLTIKLPGCENLWVELTSQNDPKGSIIGVIYRHGFCSISDIQSELSAGLHDLRNATFHICGDVNINLLNPEASPQINEYTNFLWSAGAKTIITKPTRIGDSSATLLDHIYTNDLRHEVETGVLVFDISDHLPIYALCRRKMTRVEQKHCFRDDQNLNKDLLSADLYEILYNELCDSNTVHETSQIRYEKLISLFAYILDKHVPLKQVSHKIMKFKAKLWLTPGIIKSITPKTKCVDLVIKTKIPIALCNITNNMLINS